MHAHDDTTSKIEPLPYRRRRSAFIVLLILFVTSLPFLYLYATGYRFDFGEVTNIVSTGGIYVAADRTGAEIYIDGELVRETRVFRRAFYAQNLIPGTHRVTVQKDGHHTWVKELPVEPHLVTEAAAFNLPLVPQVRIITDWQSATGSAVLFAPLSITASTTNSYVLASTTETINYTPNAAFTELLEHFATTSATSSLDTREQPVVSSTLFSSSGDENSELATTTATTTKTARDVILFESGDDVFARYTGPSYDMPYYYCTPPYPPYVARTQLRASNTLATLTNAKKDVVIHPIEPTEEDVPCDPTIRMDRQGGKEVLFFDFYPGSSDLVVMQFTDGLYLVEIDNRRWQNAQPLFLKEDIDVRIENGRIYVYDGEIIYELIV